MTLMTKGAKTMERIERDVEVRCPVRTVYDQWTQFEEFPRFMDGVKEVTQIDDTRVHWRGEIWGKERDWTSEITEQVPDTLIAWRSTSGPANAGEVRFEPLGPELTRVHLTMWYEPDGALENVADALGVVKRRLHKTVDQFRRFIEDRGHETGAWREEVHGGSVQSTTLSSGGQGPRRGI
jgi:uncharacterized membrane protein